MSAARQRLIVAVFALVVWTGITMFGASYLFPASVQLIDLVKSGIGWQFVIASAFLVALALIFRWDDLGLHWPRDGRSWVLLWFPALYLVAFASFAVYLGLPPAQTVFWIFVNTMFVGFSEELMFRGVLLAAFRRNMPIWPAIILTCVLFGSVHILNAFMTGQVLGATVQAVTAMMSGLLFVAIVLRTGSLLPAIILHGLWDFCTFLLTTATSATGEGAAPGWQMQIIMPVGLVSGNFLYALFLLRHTRTGTVGAGA